MSIESGENSSQFADWKASEGNKDDKTPENEYLDSHLESGPGWAGEGAKRLLTIPFREVRYRPEGKLMVKRGPFRLKIDYQKPDITEIPPEATMQIITDENESWKILNNLVFWRKDRHAPSLELTDIIPEGYKVLFKSPTGQQVGEPEQDTRCFVDVEHKMYHIKGDLATPAALLNLLHEVGHSYDYEQQASSIKPSEFDDAHGVLKEGGFLLTEEAMATVLRRERNAWAYALKKIRPFLDRDASSSEYSITTSEVRDYIMDYCLRTYGEGIREKLGQVVD